MAKFNSYYVNDDIDFNSEVAAYKALLELSLLEVNYNPNKPESEKLLYTALHDSTKWFLLTRLLANLPELVSPKII